MSHPLTKLHATRRENLKLALDVRGKGARTALAKALDVTQASISHLLSPLDSPGARHISEATARQIEAAWGLPSLALDKDNGQSPGVELGKPLTVDLLEETARSVLEVVSAQGRELAPESAAVLIRLAAERALVLGKQDPAFVAEVLGYA